MKEKFATIDGFPKYQISSQGRVINSRGMEKVSKNNKDEYLHVDLYDRGSRTTKRIHRLVAEAFVPNPDNKPDVNHKDGNKHNNSVDNLEWVTKSENMIHAYRTGLNKPHAAYGMRGHKNPNGGRKGLPVRIVETGEEFKSIKDCAIAINGNDRGICDCLNGRQHTHRDLHFERL